MYSHDAAVAAVDRMSLAAPVGLALMICMSGLAGCDDISAGTKRASINQDVKTVQQNHAPRYSRSGYDLAPLTQEQVDEICKTLTPEQVRIRSTAALAAGGRNDRATSTASRSSTP